MTAISLREYAQQHGISYEAVRKSVVKYQKELEGHISTQNKTKYLDEEAQKILDEKRRVNPIVLLEETSTEEIKELNEQIRMRDEQIKLLQDKIIQLQDKNVDLIEYRAQTQIKLEDKQRVEKELTEANNELTEARIELARKDTELSSFKKSIFGFYRKK